MCGIVGYVGSREATGILIGGLRRLEYRGYDSAGIAVVSHGSLERRRSEGKLSNLERALRDKPLSGENVRVRLTKNPESLPPDMSEVVIGGRTFTEGTFAESYGICLQGSVRFCLDGDESYKETMKEMIGTLREI